MIRGHLAGSALNGEKGFRWRGGEITRLEGFSDAVFAFALTLLVVSLEVPKTFHELMEAMRGFVGFGACFSLLAIVWFNHFRFFRRYGLQNPWAVFLNCLLLFFVLFYVYPLKFLFSVMLAGAGDVHGYEARALMVIYGLGYSAVFFVFTLLHVHAWRKRDLLELDPLERLKTRHSLVDASVMVSIGLISALMAALLPAQWIGLAGYFYFSIAAYFTVAGMIFGKQERLLFEGLQRKSVSPAAI